MIRTKEYILILNLILIVLFFTIFLNFGSKVFADNTYSEKYFQNSNKGSGFDTGYYYISAGQNVYEIPNIAMTNKYGTVEMKDNNTDQIYTLFPEINNLGNAQSTAQGNIQNNTQNAKGYIQSNAENNFLNISQSFHETKAYNQIFDLKQYDSINMQYKKFFPNSEENLNELFWVLNNLCNTIDDDSKDDLLDAANINRQIFKTYKINGKSIEQSENDLIKVIQQAVIWNICKGDTKNIPTIYVSKNRDGEKINLNDAFKNYDNAAEKLYEYFLNSAINAEKNGYVYKDLNSDVINLDKTRAQISEENANYVIGPYKVTTNSGFEDFNVSITDGLNEISNVKLVKDDKTTEIQGNNALEKVKANLGEDFYIVVPISTSASKIRINVGAKFERKNLTYYSVGANAINSSLPIVKVRNEKTSVLNYDIKNILKPNFDLSLREFISTVNNVEPKENRECKVAQADLDRFVQGNSSIDNGTTIVKNHIKTPLSVNTGDLINIKIRVYNEGQIDGTADELTNYIQYGLEFVEDSEINKKYGWTKTESGNVIKTNYLSDKKIKAFSNQKTNNLYNVSYEEIELELRVKANVKTTDTILKNITEISKSSNDQNEADRDSVANDLNENQIKNYSPGSSSAGKGYEDDDDFEAVNLVGKYFDLSLRFFVSQVINKNGNVVNYNREPNVDVSTLKNGGMDAIYKSSKSPVGIEIADSIVFTIRVYNEGQIDGYADEIVTHLPEELEYVNDEFNSEYGWIIDKTDATQRTLKSEHLSMQKDEDNAIKGYDGGDKLNYKDIKLKLKLRSMATTKKEITTIAEIIKSSNKFGISDRDDKLNVSMPSDKELQNYKGNSENKDELSDSSYYYKGQEDDDDFEKIVFEKFDLALRVFETNINGNAVKDRVPDVDSSEFGASTESTVYTTCKYNNKKDVINVNENDKIEFTIRVYNEGTQNGYAKELKNDIPDGLEFVVNDATNKKFKWKMYDENNNETDDIPKCKYVKTNYLSKENDVSNLITSFDKGKMSSPNYKEVKIVLNVKLKDKNNSNITEKAQISDDSDEDGNSVTDIDSAPNEENNNEDDQDQESLHILKFDLSLKQEVSQIITIENGYQTISEIKDKENFKFDANKNNLKNKVVKFKYSIKVANEGEDIGTASEISDYIPKGLKFNQADNLNWMEKDNKIVTDELKDKMINPRESATVELILTLDTEANLSQSLSNVCEISKQKNNNSIDDIDSTPNNQKDGEDDYCKVDVLIYSANGNMGKFLPIIIVAMLLIIIGGVVLIKKFVVKA